MTGKATLIVCLLLLVQLTGCTAIHRSIAKGELDVQTRMSQTIYLDPVEPELRTVFLDFRSTAAEFQQPLDAAVAEFLQQRGYQLTQSPAKAHYWLQVNVRTVLKQAPEKVLAKAEFGMSHEEIEQLLNPALLAMPAFIPEEVEPEPSKNRSSSRSTRSSQSNVYVGYSDGVNVDSRDLRNLLIAAAVIAGTEYAGRQLVKDVYYTMVTDLQVAERIAADSDEWVLEYSQHLLLQGDSGSSDTLWERATDRRKYQARVISFANQANLKWEDAEPGLQSGLIRSLAGIF
ncbi:complement resistance protein TraT [Alkalimonas delamerensis]|uniref:Complement resistance protein TraT n=1 Tax=Alkalimonas delamerensis TaxID=265981 RepID=A0ABT9GU27_9GAMM|nr:complement resistance protein TraT [Alkalimonas delamerensis]MDP4530442.1 complement resistance protein TraT [Alkalimonas delamerensis]